MKRRTHSRFFELLFFIALLAGATVLQAAEPVPATPVTNKPAGESPVVTPAFEQMLQQMQEQQLAALRAIEQIRLDAAAASQHNDEVVAARLRLIEQALTDQRERELESLRSSNRFTLIIVAVFAGVGLIGMLINFIFLFRAMNRLAEVAGAFPGSHALLPAPAAGALTSSEAMELSAGPAGQTSRRFLNVIERLERRVLELEASAHPSAPPATGHPAEEAGSLTDVKFIEPAPAGDNPISSEKTARISLLLGKGQALLNLDQAGEALSCFEEVLELDPANTDALVKKAKMFEKLRRMQDALDSYDLALAVDKNLTIAYLGKGSVYNRLERFNEALECYEQALRTQQHPRAA